MRIESVADARQAIESKDYLSALVFLQDHLSDSPLEREINLLTAFCAANAHDLECIVTALRPLLSERVAPDIAHDCLLAQLVHGGWESTGELYSKIKRTAPDPDSEADQIAHHRFSELECELNRVRHEPVSMLQQRERFSEALRAQNQGRYADSIKLWDMFLDTASRSSLGWNNKADALLNIRHLEHAFTCIVMSIQLNPTVNVSWCTLGEIMMQRDVPEIALSCFEHSLKLCTTSVQPSKFHIQYLSEQVRALGNSNV